MLILLILLILLLGGGGGYYGHSRWGYGGGAGIGLGTVLIILLIVYLLGGLPTGRLYGRSNSAKRFPECAWELPLGYRSVRCEFLRS